MTTGKGDKRRPQFVDEKIFEANWNQTFISNPNNPNPNIPIISDMSQFNWRLDLTHEQRN